MTGSIPKQQRLTTKELLQRQHKALKLKDTSDREVVYACGGCGKSIKTGCYCSRCAKEMDT